MHIGVVGGGQLGRMLGLAGIPLGFRFTFLDPSPEAGAGAVGELLVAGYDEEHALDQLRDECDVVTYEFENVPATSARYLTERVPVWPPPRALGVAQDRMAEKQAFESAGLTVPSYRSVDSDDDIRAAAADLGSPLVVKTRREGYDGKGQRVISSEGDIAGTCGALGAVPLIAESFVDFDRELSLIAVRSTTGEQAFYPLVENTHHEGILRTARPAPAADALQEVAEQLASSLLDALGYAGVLTIEMFEVAGELLGNEMAPRVHNSGHWTIEGSVTSQFENHLRAITGLPLGSTATTGSPFMLNLIGEIPDPEDVLGVPGAHLHLYGKSARPGRKVGHVTVCAEDDASLTRTVHALAGLPGTWQG
ncbi:MAG: 5-(carboxyamino)imidazole ribonucleotide synthase [Actinomycetota bacterium]